MARVRRSFKIIRNGRHVGTASFLGPTIKAAESEARKFARKVGARLATPKSNSRRKNVAAGFMDKFGEFHPVRASYDYSRKRVGESEGFPRARKSSKRRKSTKRKKR